MSSNSILLEYSQIMPSKQPQNLTVSILIPHHHFPPCFSDLTCFDTQADASCIRVISVIAVSTVETGTAGSHGSRTSQMCKDENYVTEPRRGHEDFFFLLRDTFTRSRKEKAPRKDGARAPVGEVHSLILRSVSNTLN